MVVPLPYYSGWTSPGWSHLAVARAGAFPYGPRWLMVLLGTATVPVALVAGLLDPVAIVVAAVVVSLPAWLMVLMVRRRVGDTLA